MASKLSFSCRLWRRLEGASKVKLIRNGIDQAIFRPDDEARAKVRQNFGWDQHTRVVALAAAASSKGGEVALRAFSLSSTARRPPATDDRRRRGTPRGSGLAEDLRCARDVQFTGPVARHEIPALLAASDAFAFPTLRREGLPMNVLEALACGLEARCAPRARNRHSLRTCPFATPTHDIAQFSEALLEALRTASAGALLPRFLRLGGVR